MGGGDVTGVGRGIGLFFSFVPIYKFFVARCHCYRHVPKKKEGAFLSLWLRIFHKRRKPFFFLLLFFHLEPIVAPFLEFKFLLPFGPVGIKEGGGGIMNS